MTKPFSIFAAMGELAPVAEPWKGTDIPLGMTRFDLLAPDPAAVDLQAVADQLARLPRWNGATPGGIWSVAAHSRLVESVLAARDLARATPRLRCLALIHDFHEAMIGDLTVALRRALIAKGGSCVETALTDLTAPIDAAIYAAMGIAPPDEEEAMTVAAADKLAASIEWRALIPHDARPRDLPEPPPWPVLRPQPWPMESAALLDRLADLATELCLTGPAADGLTAWR